MRLAALSVLLAALVASAQTINDKEKEDGFVPLFNGKDLAGWKVHDAKSEVWVAEDGMVVCTGKGGGWLGSERDYADFILRLDYRLKPGGNSGVYIRAPEKGHISRVGMEVQLLDDFDPRYAKIDFYQFTGSIYHVVAPTQRASKPAGEWNSIEIQAVGREVRVILNGKKIVDADLDRCLKDSAVAKEHTGLARATGRIGLQSHTDRVEFRNLRVKELKQKPFDVFGKDSFLGISSDFKVVAISDGDGLKIVDVETGKQLAAPTWDRDWGSPLSVAFGNDDIAVLAGMFSRGQWVKIFSRKTLDLHQNVRGRINEAAFTQDGRVLAFTEFRAGDGHHLILRDVSAKKAIADMRLGGDGYCSLVLAKKHVAAYESSDDQITVVEIETGKALKQLKAGPAVFANMKEFKRRVPMPLAISQSANLIACAAGDVVVLYDIEGGKVAHKLEGHLDVVRAVAFSFNGEIVASSARDKTIRFWNVSDGKEIHTMKSLPAVASELIFFPDGKRIVVVYGDKFPGMNKAEIRNLDLK